MKNRKIISNCYKILLFILIILVCCYFGDKLLVNASQYYSYLSTEKIFANVELNDDFDDSSVIVILDRNISGINKNHDSTIFRNLNSSEIVDLTYVNDVTTVIDTSNFEQIFQIKLLYPGKENVISMIEYLKDIPGIKYVGPNNYLEMQKSPNDTLYSSIVPEITQQWSHRNMDSEKAWDFTTGNSKIRVGVIDSGVSNHPDLNQNLSAGYDFANMINNTTPGVLRDDNNGHGTHIAGIIGAVGNNSLGICGVNWKVSIVPMQIKTNEGYTSSAACVRAINYARNIWNTNNRISILSMSIGGSDPWPEIETAIRQFQGLFVCSTGNKNQNNDETFHYPSFYASSLHTNPLTNMITVGRSDINDNKSVDANYGNKTIMLYAPGENIISTYPLSLCSSDGFRCTSSHIEYGYHSFSGSSMATPQVSGVAALLLSINPNLSAQQLKSAILNSVDIPNVNGTNPLKNLCVTNGRLNAYNAVKYVLMNYMNPSIYTLSNYSNMVDTNKIITSDASSFNDLNGFYKLNVTYEKNYEFICTSTSGIDITLYDENLNEISYVNFSSTNNKVHFIKNLNVGTYYLRTKYINEDNTGTINTKIISRNTAYLGIGENDILLNSYNGFRNYNYINQNNPGFYKFTLVGEKKNNSTIIYPSSALKIYGDANKTQLLQRLDLDEYDNSASLKQNENDMYVYLPWRGYFYLDVNFNAADLKSLKLVITEVTSKSLNLFDLAEDANESINVINETKKGDYFKELNLKQTGKFTLTFNYSGIQNDNIFVVLTKQNYNAATAEYLLDTKFIILLNKDNPIYTYTMSLEDGKYYIGYFNKTDTSRITATFKRLVTQSGSEVLVTDPDQGTLCGSQINIIEMNHSNKSYRENYITVGFTRLIYPDYNYGISPSRLDYNWYSSNTSIAIVTNYGTVLGKSLGTVKIMAVLKSDPSRVYVKEFTIIEDISYNTVEVHSTYTVKYSRDVVNGKFHFDIEKINCPYPWLQDYTWSLNNNCHNDSFSASMDHWGDITINGTGCFTLTGTYNVNRKYKVIIHFVIEP